jgi:hypothetical protein
MILRRAEGRALFAAKLAYLEAKISPEPTQEEAWRSFADAMRASAGAVDRACVEDPPRPLSADAGERLKHMERHAAAMQAMFGAMANAYVAIAPNLTDMPRTCGQGESHGLAQLPGALRSDRENCRPFP